MKIYSHYGFNDFVVCLGYKGYCIKEYFAHYFLHESDITFDFRNSSQRSIHHHTAEPWQVTLVDTGAETMTGGRVKRVREYLDDEPFMLTYGDGVGNVNIAELVAFHKAHGKLATLTSTKPSGKFGALSMQEGDRVESFLEKPRGDGSWINAGFFVLQPEVLDLIEEDSTIFEKEPLEGLANRGELMAFKHDGFWQPMDTLRDKNLLEDLWRENAAPWKLW